MTHTDALKTWKLHSLVSWLIRSTTCCFLWFTNCVLLSDKWSNTKMLVTFSICFKQYFATRYLVFCNLSHPSMFLPLDLLAEYRFNMVSSDPCMSHLAIPTWIFCREVSGFATDCPCGVWCHGLTRCLLHVGPPFGNWLLNNGLAVGVT